MVGGHALHWLAPALLERSSSNVPQYNVAPAVRAESLVPVQPVQVSGLSMCEAEDLLDWLEANGIASRKLHLDPARGFTVTYEPLEAVET